MRICLATLHYDPARAHGSARDYLAQLPIMYDLPQALAAHGHDVYVVFLYPQAASWSEGHVHYHFVPADSPARWAARAAGRLSRREWTRGLPAREAIRRIRQLRPDVIHFHGLILTVNLFWLIHHLSRCAPPIVGHYHGGFPSRNPLLRRLQAASLRRLSRALFTTQAHAQPFLDAGLLQPCQVEELMEVSTAFTRQPRAAARAATGMTGSPVFLWAGRLHPVKDPLTGLRGFARIQAAWPGAHLYLTYLTDELLPALQRYLDARPQLAPHVHFRGRVPHAEMETVYNSADFLLQASQREYSGYAVLEAMACGVIPVVTAIPSFQRMTGDGRSGVLFPPGDPDTLARRVLAIDREAIPALSAAVQRRFEEQFSYPAMAARLLVIYEQALSERETAQAIPAR